MSHNIIFPAPDGATYAIPDVDDEGWGQSVTNFLTAIPAGVPPRSGTFSLTGDLSFGTSFGLVSPYYKSSTANISTAGTLRLAKTDVIGWRNNANSANLLLALNGSDQLTFNGSVIGSSAQGPDRSIQFNNAGTIDGDSGLTFTTSGGKHLNINDNLNPQLTLYLSDGTSQLAAFGSDGTTLTISSAMGSIDFGTPGPSNPVAIDNTLTVGRGDTSIDPSAIVEIAATTLGFLPPRMTTTQRNAIPSPATGLQIYNTTTGKNETYNGTAWVSASGTTAGLTALRAVATDAGGNLASSATTSTELGFVNGVTSSIQTQINTKAPSASPTFTGTIGTPLTASSIVSTDGSGNLTTLTDPLSVAHGGSGDASHTAYAVLCGGTTSTAPVQSVSGVGSAGQALVSNGAGTLPTWQNVSGSGTINSGTAGQIAYYAGSGTTISGNTPLTISGTSLTLNGSNATFAIVGPGVTSSQLELTANSHNNQIQTDSTGRLTIADITDSHIWFTFDPAPSITAGSVLSMGSNKITNVTDPTSAQDAATKNYVDTNAHLISTPIMGTHTGFDSLSANTTFTSTSLSASIIPKSVSSKILVRVTGTCAIGSPQTQGYWTIDRSGTNLGGTNGLTQYQVPSGSVGNFVPCAMQYLDSPATTSSITYTVQQRCSSAAGTVQFGEVNGISVIILEEVI